MPLQFAITLFLSASLLFMVQPMVGKMVLPLLGGSPAVWNACMVFFQALLLLGYLYAHKITTKFDPRRQWLIHMGVLVVPLGVMIISAIFSDKNSPIAIAESLAPSGDMSPFLSVMAILTVAIGIPFFVSSTSAPLLQKWFANTGHPSARDPYFLYAASNAGSLIFLLGYPLIIEPNLKIVPQAWVWAGGFTILAVLIFLCGRAALRPLTMPSSMAKANTAAAPMPYEAPPAGWRKVKWVMLAFVPSSLMLGVTFHMTTDIASIPLLWVGPLALYLLTFIIAFSTVVPPWFRLVIGNLAPVMILLLVFVMISGVSPGVGIELLLHMLTFFAAALMCHYELAHDRPGPEHLTGYFLLMSVGGVLGGLFNALFAPLVFAQSYEYRLTLIMACFMVPVLSAITAGDPESDRARFTGANPLAYLRSLTRKQRFALALDFIIPILVGLGFWGLLRLSMADWFIRSCVSIATTLSISVETVIIILRFAVPVMVCFFFVDRPIRFGLCVAAILGVNMYFERDHNTVYSERSFFGILKVEKQSEGQRPAWVDAEGDRVVSGKIHYLRLVHGTTLHGTQIKELENNVFDYFQLFPTTLTPWDAVAVGGTLEKFDARQEPLTYYHRTGPVGAMFHELRTRKGGSEAKADVAMVGLGTGSVACYAEPGQRLTFYEIDPAVKKLVADTDEYFTYVTDARKRGATVDFQMGDARLKLKDDVDRRYALLLVDAFSSDSIPVHLLTREAVQMYLERMTEDGILALHISNKFVALEPVVAQIAADLNLEARVWNDGAESRPGKTASSWVVLARKKEHLGKLAATQPEQVGSFVEPRSTLLELAQKHGESTKLIDALKADYGQEVEIVIDLLKRYRSSARLKRLLTLETTPQLLLIEDLKKKHGGDMMLRTAIQKQLAPNVAELEPLIKTYGETTTLQKVWDEHGGPRIDLLRRWVDKYAVGDPEPIEGDEDGEGGKMPLGGTALIQAVHMDHGLRFLDAASTLTDPKSPGAANITLKDALLLRYRELFRKLHRIEDLPTWTDDYSDVLRVMMIPEVQKLRGWFGLPNKLE